MSTSAAGWMRIPVTTARLARASAAPSPAVRAGLSSMLFARPIESLRWKQPLAPKTIATTRRKPRSEVLPVEELREGDVHGQG